MIEAKRVAVVTGAGRGIGAACAKSLARKGAQVIVSDLLLDGAEQTAEAIVAAGGQAVAVACDVSVREDVESLMNRSMEVYGRLDILVNNAGIIRDNLIHKMTDDDFDQVIGVHLKGTWLCSQAAQRHMVANRYGRIINFSSTSALGNRGQANYAAAKAGIQGLTKTLAIELGRFGITCNAVAPGFIESDMTKETAARIGVEFAAFKEMAARETAVLRIGTPEDVAYAVTFFASEEAAFITGQVLYIRGGV
ncbi:MAG: 3-oxoacyl-ACP reductase FabG [Firmicutes bacterium]|nr:3-oxoacyl-ACP reductase FabG [Bacillota bacterium]